MPIKTELKMQIKKSFQVDLSKNSNEIKWALDRVFETGSKSYDVVTKLFWSNVKWVSSYGRCTSLHFTVILSDKLAKN